MIILLLPPGGVIYPSYPEGRKKEDPSGCSNYLVISGESNVNQFSFTFKKTAPEKNNNPRYNLLQNGTEILIPIRGFEASNPHMYRDFLLQMKESIYPYLSIRFLDFGSEKFDQRSGYSNYKVRITLAGVSREYAIDCEFVSCGGNLMIKGSETLKLTEFNIPPPQKLNGLIKVRNEITVSFSIMTNFASENTYAVSR